MSNNKGKNVAVKSEKPNAQEAGPFRIMFVCLGNICRSPAAQGILESMIRTMGLEKQFSVDSAGTAGYHIGRLPDIRMVEAAFKRG